MKNIITSAVTDVGDGEVKASLSWTSNQGGTIGIVGPVTNSIFNEAIEKKWIEQGVTLEYNASNNGYYTGYYLTIPIKHHFLKGTKLAEFVRNGVISLRDNMIKPMNLKKP